MLKRLAYLTCELKSRDLDSRILIAGHLINQGIPVVIGQQWGMFLAFDLHTKGCFLFKTANKIQAKNVKQAREYGHLAVTMDEEALPLSGDILLENVHPDSVKYSNRFLVQNNAHRDVLAGRYPDYKDRMIVTGNPRMDVLAASQHAIAHEAQSIRSEIGPYVLFNTGFAITNSVWKDPQKAIAYMIKGMDPASSSRSVEAQIAERIDAEQAGRKHIMALINHLLTALPTHKIVVRPHPAENIDEWKTLAVQNNRLHIVAGSAAPPWMVGADVVFHSESTTGIEGAYVGARCINISPTPQWSRHFIINQVNTTVGSAQKALELLSTPVELKCAAEVLDGLFPRGAAKSIADAIAEQLNVANAQPLDRGKLEWMRSEPEPWMMEKFNVPHGEFVARIQALLGSTAIRPYSVAHVQNSIFLLEPHS